MRIRLAISFIERPEEYIPTTSPRRSMDKDFPLPMAKSTSHNGTQPGQSGSQSGSHSTALDDVRHDIDQSVVGAPFYVPKTTDERQILRDGKSSFLQFSMAFNRWFWNLKKVAKRNQI